MNANPDSKLQKIIPQKRQYQKILLALLPFWDPLIPANGIASLKRYLEKFGYNVKTADLTISNDFLNHYRSYFGKMETFIPESNWGNFFNTGHDVLQRNLMAHINYTDERSYAELVKQLVYFSFYHHITDQQARRLIEDIDGCYKLLEKYFLNLLEKEKPDVLGLTAYKGILGPCLFVYRLARRHYPHILNVMGGTMFADSHAVDSPNYNIILEETKDYIDKIIIGPGETLFLKLLEGQLPENQRIFILNDMKDEKPLDFAEIDLPDYSDFTAADYPYMPITASASCPFKCSFCNSTLYWGNFRIKDPKQTAREMKKLHEMYGSQLFFMTDSTINPVIKRLSEELLKMDVSLYYDGYFRPDRPSANMENTMKWRRSGFYRARLGIETGSQRIIDMMKKKVTVQQIKDSLAGLAYAGIKTTTYWVIGYPGETEDDFQETLQFLEDAKNDIWQAEPAPFMYQYSGQVNSSQWENMRILVYPESATRMIKEKTWTLNSPPSREEAYRRTHRFVMHCKKLGIPNPYSVQEHFYADERWKRLHSNAVPALLEFRETGKYVDENKTISIASFARNVRQNQEDNFDF
jgi:hypothetical protein